MPFISRCVISKGTVTSCVPIFGLVAQSMIAVRALNNKIVGDPARTRFIARKTRWRAILGSPGSRIQDVLVDLLILEDKAGTGEPGFSFLEFGDVERRDVEASSFDAGARAGKGRRKNDRAAQSESVGGVRLGGVDVNPMERGEHGGIEPCAIRKQSFAAQRGNGGFEMQAARDGNSNDFVIVRSEDRA